MESLRSIRNQVITADGVAGADVQLTKSEPLTVKELVFTAADEVHRRFHMF